MRGEPAGLIEALTMLREAGHPVDRAAYPALPWKGLWLVDDQEMTGEEIIEHARTIAGRPLE